MIIPPPMEESHNCEEENRFPATAPCRSQSRASSLCQVPLSKGSHWAEHLSVSTFLKAKCQTQLVSETQHQVILDTHKRQLGILGKHSPWQCDKERMSKDWTQFPFRDVVSDSLHLWAVCSDVWTKVFVVVVWCFLPNLREMSWY